MTLQIETLSTKRSRKALASKVEAGGIEPWFPNVCRRVLNHDLSVPVTFVAFDLLRVDCTDLCDCSYAERRDLLVSLGLAGPGGAT